MEFQSDPNVVAEFRVGDSKVCLGPVAPLLDFDYREPFRFHRPSKRRNTVLKVGWALRVPSPVRGSQAEGPQGRGRGPTGTPDPGGSAFCGGKGQRMRKGSGC